MERRLPRTLPDLQQYLQHRRKHEDSLQGILGHCLRDQRHHQHHQQQDAGVPGHHHQKRKASRHTSRHPMPNQPKLHPKSGQEQERIGPDQNPPPGHPGVQQPELLADRHEKTQLHRRGPIAYGSQGQEVPQHVARIGA